jgi:hypothetical protein
MLSALLVAAELIAFWMRGQDPTPAPAQIAAKESKPGALGEPAPEPQPDAPVQTVEIDVQAGQVTEVTVTFP